MRDKVSSLIMSFLYVFKIYIKNAPIKVLAEYLLIAAKSILVVVNSVWLLGYLTGMIMEERMFEDAFNVLALVVGINIFLNFMQYFYEHCIKPRNELKIRRYLEKSLMEQAERLPLYYYENSEFYTIVKQAQKVTSDTIFSAYYDITQIVCGCVGKCDCYCCFN